MRHGLRSATATMMRREVRRVFESALAGAGAPQRQAVDPLTRQMWGQLAQMEVLALIGGGQEADDDSRP